MQVHFGVELLHAEWPGAVTCVGTFDGVHLGHQAVITRAVETAREQGLPCGLVTFDRHPAAVLAPDRCPKALASLASNIRAFDSLGVSVALILAFDEALSQTTAQTFLDEVLVERLRSQLLVLGHDFALGRGREGTPEWLSAHIATEVVPPFEIGGSRVSSSAIRRAVEAGEMGSASRWLGRPFEIEGVVVAGARLGRQLGFPTINLARSFDQVLPADGIYAGTAECSLGSFGAAISIGVRPAVAGTSRTIEAFLLDYPGDEIYGYSVRLKIRERLRAEQNFGTLDELKAQISADVEAVSNLLAGMERP